MTVNASQVAAAVLYARTSRSAEVDLATSSDTTLNETPAALAPTGVCGPVGNGMAATTDRLVFCYSDGAFYFACVIDADYTGEIKIICRHFGYNTLILHNSPVKEKAQVMVKKMSTNEWEGPAR